MKNFYLSFLLPAVFLVSCSTPDKTEIFLEDGTGITLSTDVLRDKIMGAWAGQVIGCTYGGPTEFRWKGTMIPDDHFIPWYNGIVKWWYENAPGLYDDIYMDLTFVDVFEKEGLDAPVDSFAYAFANAEYQLWHANQAARYNILNGILPPESGHWKNNPHSDDIDFQIEADFAGIMAPGMARTAAQISDGIGHIMNYGDGWYGGVYVATMYALSFISDDIVFVVKESLKAIPEMSNFHKLISDVISWYDEYPADWKMNWFLTQEKWASETGCPDGVFADFNIDAKMNAAYIVIGLLYGEGDFGKTMQISTLCGQDSDCNPASACGILGTISGYSGIPPIWTGELKEVEDINFKYTDISLNNAYDYSFRHALSTIVRSGGTITDDSVTILYQEPAAVKLEQGFEGHFPVEYKELYHSFDKNKAALEFNFRGNGFVLNGGCSSDNNPQYSGRIEVKIDGQTHETVSLPASFSKRRHELTWAYDLEEGIHHVEVTWQNPEKGAGVHADKIIVYSSVKEKRTRPETLVVN